MKITAGAAEQQQAVTDKEMTGSEYFTVPLFVTC